MTETHNQTTYFHEIPNGKIGYSNEGKILYLFRGDAIMQEIWPVERKVYKALLTFFGIEYNLKEEEYEKVSLGENYFLEEVSLAVIEDVEYKWNENIELRLLHYSDVFKSWAYDKKRHNLYLVFHNKPDIIWVYFHVPDSYVEDMFDGRSIGTFYNAHIKGQYKTTFYEI